MPPVIVISCTGLLHIIFTIWTVRSLLKLGYDTIEIIVREDWEKVYLKRYLKDISCEVVDVDRGEYGVWAFRPFALEKYTIKNSTRDVVICDTDILWKKDPRLLFKRFFNKNWVHKITALNPADLYMDIKAVPRSRIGLKTMINYMKRNDPLILPNFHLNCGLFMLSHEIFPEVLKRWVESIRTLPANEMIMTEALLSMVYAEMELNPISDREDIKHLKTVVDESVEKKVICYDIADIPEGMFSGYQTAQHYFGSQRQLLFEDVRCLGIDEGDNLLNVARKEWNRIKIKTFPKKVKNKIKNILGIWT